MEEKKKMGRPIKGDSVKSKKLGIRVSPEDLELISSCAEELNMSRADTIVYGVKKLYEELNK